MNIDAEFTRFLQTVETWLGEDEAENDIARLILVRQIQAGREVEAILDLRPEMTVDDPDLQLLTGLQFMRFDDGGWFGHGGYYAPSSKLGMIMEAEYQTLQARKP